MTKPVVAVTRRIPVAGIELLKPEFELRIHDSSLPPDRETVLKMLKNADAALTLLSDKIDQELLENCPKLKIIANMAVGYDNVDINAATAHKVWVTNTPGVLTDSTADLTLALILAICRRVVEADAFMRAGNYKAWDPRLLRGMELNNKTLGIFGFGRIGQAVAARARAFGMNIVYCNRSEKKEAAASLQARRVSKEQLLMEADVLSIHTPYAAELHHAFGEAEFAAMKKEAFFINTARGAIMDEGALLNALKTGEIAGAGLDVFEKEPLFVDGLAEQENVIMLPHIGSATFETRDAMATLAAENIVAVLNGKSPVTPVNRI